MLKNKNIPHYSSLLLQESRLAEFVVGLPPVNLQDKLKGESAYYGAADMIARAVGLPCSGVTKEVCWEHGWKYNPITTPEQMSGYSDREKVYLVANSHHETILKDAGFPSVDVVGMPYIYAPNCSAERIPNSLLVCPGHATNFSEHDWTEFANKYAASIASIKHEFSTVVVCLTANCIERNQWIEAFEAYDIPWIMGASIYDRNALARMRSLFGGFEYVTSNMIGSHLVYAAYESCKVSIWKWQPLYSVDGFRNEPLFLKNPELLKQSVWYTHEWQMEHYGFLFQDHPREGGILKEWAEEQLGKENKRSVQDVARLLGWLGHRVRGDCVLSPFHTKRSFLSQLFARFRWLRNSRGLLKMKRNQPGCVQYFNESLRYHDASSFVHQVDHVYHKESRFLDSVENPSLIIDAGADVGVDLLYIKKRYPRAKVICFEPDALFFDCLEANVISYKLTDCELHNTALSKDVGILEFSRGVGGRLVRCLHRSDFNQVPVRGSRLRPFLIDVSVDLIKLNGVYTDVEVLEDCLDLLINVDCIHVTYPFHVNQLKVIDQMFQFLKRAGYQVQITQGGGAIKQPLNDLKAPVAENELLEVHAIRETVS
jgi:FkbM family methyltransferase